ncbi:MAG: hypothetical protein JJU01_03205 [Alkalibacterium sp.]|nr:hypothetical protein [Alkalibacterium sp.]
MLYLENSRLKVAIQEPGELYRGSRFDWTGFVSQITLDESVNFCVPEQLEEGKGTGGLGFCNEFGMEKPIGYDDIRPGEEFPKIGVGLLKKDTEEAYDFFKAYDVTPVETEIRQDDDSITFDLTSSSESDYSYRLVKKISLKVNRLTYSYQLKNTGKLPIHTNEYSHNFIGINNQAIGSGYRLTIPNMEDIDIAVGSISKSANQLTWEETPEADFYASISWNKTDADYNWDLYNNEVGAGVKELSDFKPSKVALWGYTHVVCPELFIDIDLEPGETKKWERVYEFYQEDEKTTII